MPTILLVPLWPITLPILILIGFGKFVASLVRDVRSE